MRLYSPLTADLFEPDNGDWEEDEECNPDEPIELDGYELEPYQDVILKGIADEKVPKEETRGLMAYFHGSREVDEKVISLHPTVEVVDKRLYGVAVCKVRGKLTMEELEELKDYASGQYSDGWGEGAEQRPRQTSNGELYFHFWQSKGFYIRTAEEMGFRPLAPALKQELSAPVQHIDGDGFWRLIASAKERFGQDTTASANWLQEQLTAMAPEESLRFQTFMVNYSNYACCYGLWNAAIVLCESGCSDDGFIDFRAWLIAQGKDIYMAALKDPDSLADVVPYADCDFESLCYVGATVYNRLTGKSVYGAGWPESLKRELNVLKKEIIYGPGIDRPLEWAEMAKHLPRLCAKYLTPEKLERNAMRGHVWNHSNPNIQRAFHAARKESQCKRGGDAR